MSRSGYSDDYDMNWANIRWRGAVASALRGKRGQAFLREMRDALDAMPEKRLIAHEIVSPTGCCAIGAVALRRGLDVTRLDPEDRKGVAATFGIAEAMAGEIAYMNDEAAYYADTPEKRWLRMREWVEGAITEESKL